jgi:hypothetical protein
MPKEDSFEDIQFRDLAPSMEYVSWVIVLLAPIVRFIDGASVTSDQTYIRSSLFAISLVCAVSLRIYRINRR